MNNQEKNTIKVKDRNGNYNNWIAYETTENTIKVYAECDKRYITELDINKLHIGFYDNKIYSDEVKNPFSLMDERYMKTEFCEIWCKEDEC